MTTECIFHSGAHMLLGTHPIPARSPAEREGQNGKETREGGRQRRRRDGEVGGGERGISRLNEWGRRQRKSGRRGVENDGYSQEGEERENGGITCYVSETGWLVGA